MASKKKSAPAAAPASENVQIEKWAAEILAGEVGTATLKELSDAKDHVRAALAK